MIRLIQLKIIEPKYRKLERYMYRARSKANYTFWQMMEDGTLKRAADGGVELADD